MRLPPAVDTEVIMSVITPITELQNASDSTRTARSLRAVEGLGSVLAAYEGGQVGADSL